MSTIYNVKVNDSLQSNYFDIPDKEEKKPDNTKTNKLTQSNQTISSKFKKEE